MNDIYNFIEAYKPLIPLDTYGSSLIVSEDIDKGDSLRKDPDMFIFKTEQDLIEYISTKLAESYYSNNKFLNIDESLVEAIEINGYTKYLSHIDLLQIGIEEFALYGEKDIIVVFFESIPSYERMIIDNYIWTACADKTLEKLSKLTMYKVSLESIYGVQPIIMVSYYFDKINTTIQLKKYIETKYEDSLILIADITKDTIEIENDVINIKINDFPRLIKLRVVLSKPSRIQETPWSIVTDDSFEELNFQIILKTNSSIALIPHPIELNELMNKLLHYWDKFIDLEEDFLFVPKELIHVMAYYKNNNIISPYGRIPNYLRF